jgi:hypothetical protein
MPQGPPAPAPRGLVVRSWRPAVRVSPADASQPRSAPLHRSCRHPLPVDKRGQCGKSATSSQALPTGRSTIRTLSSSAWASPQHLAPLPPPTEDKPTRSSLSSSASKRSRSSRRRRTWAGDRGARRPLTLSGTAWLSSRSVALPAAWPAALVAQSVTSRAFTSSRPGRRGKWSSAAFLSLARRGWGGAAGDRQAPHCIFLHDSLADHKPAAGWDNMHRFFAR